MAEERCHQPWLLYFGVYLPDRLAEYLGSPKFASGLSRNDEGPSPTLSAFPAPPGGTPNTSTPVSPTCTSPDKHKQPKQHTSLSPVKTLARRRRSSAIYATPASVSPQKYKAGGAENGVERALDNVMKTLRVMAMGTPIREESRWSSSSEESLMDSEETGFWRPRKSGESVRSKMTVATTKSSKSSKSLRSKKSSRRSEDTDRMDLDEDEDVPPVPLAPATPGRSRRMMDGLAKRLGLTPKK